MKKRVSLAMDEVLYHKFQFICKQESRSFNNQIVHLAKICVQDFEEEQGELRGYDNSNT